MHASKYNFLNIFVLNLLALVIQKKNQNEITLFQNEVHFKYVHQNIVGGAVFGNISKSPV